MESGWNICAVDAGADEFAQASDTALCTGEGDVVKMRVEYSGGYVFQAEADSVDKLIYLLGKWVDTLPSYIRRFIAK